MSILHAIILAIIEGLTEFLPISSTGHMVIASAFMGIGNDKAVKLFEVVVQLGCILSVLVLYYKRFLQSIQFYFKLVAAFIPVMILGLLLNKIIDKALGNVLVVATTLFFGGIILIMIDTWLTKERAMADEDGLSTSGSNTSDSLTIKKAAIIGLYQCIALIPGVSRSAATIIGGQLQGLTRKAAAEFSFFLAVPTMAAATGYKLLKAVSDGDANLITDNITPLLLGCVIAFVVGLLAIKTFVGLLTKYGFKAFGYYRVILALVIVTLYLSGYHLEVD